MTDSTLEIKKAWVAALKADAGLSALIGNRVYDEPPQNPVHPYVSFGAIVADAWDTDGNLGWEAFLQVDTWSQTPGQVEASRIMAAIKPVLHRSTLALDTQTSCLALLDFASILPWDGGVRHGVQRFRVLTHE
jgi:hypothetical protein